MIFDTHAHYDDSRFDSDRETLLNALPEQGVGLVVNCAATLASGVECVELSRQYPHIYASVGVHPHHADEVNHGALAMLEDLALEPKVVAIGEIGLDYYYDHSPREVQKMAFRSQIDLARGLKKPVIIHDRDAHEDTLHIVKEMRAGVYGGVFHCFAGSVEMAKELVKEGFHLGFGGTLTFKNARRAAEVVAWLPLDRIVIETDAPYLTPEPFRGRRNSSHYLVHVIEAIAKIRGLTTDEVEQITWQNAKTLFGIGG